MPVKTALSPRKSPQQERSKSTVEAVLDATAQVLVAGGYAKLTTTKVAERAGVSVGTLYQYFGTKEALVYALAERHFEKVLGAVAVAAEASVGGSLAQRIEALVRALLDKKAEDGLLSATLNATMAEVDGRRYVQRNLAASQQLVRALLEAHPKEHAVKDLELSAFVIVRAIDGVVGALVMEAPRRLKDPVVLRALVQLVLGFLHAPRLALAPGTRPARRAGTSARRPR